MKRHPKYSKEWNERQKRLFLEAEARVLERFGPPRKNMDGMRRGNNEGIPSWWR